MANHDLFSLLFFRNFLSKQEMFTGPASLFRSYSDAYKILFSQLGVSHTRDYQKAAYLLPEKADLKFLVNRFRRHLIFGNKREYRFLMYQELLQECRLWGYELTGADKRLLCEKLFLIKPSKINDSTFEKVLKKFERCKYNEEVLKNFNLFLKKERKYNSHQIFNVAVCATMSAGKSTFVNALLGNDVLPSRNEATTAKITSIYDRDMMTEVIGFCENSGEVVEICGDLKLDKLDEWNSRKDIDRIYLQADLNNIANKAFVLAAHDTPGTNNSGDASHHDTTLKFLKENQMDAVIYVANAQQLCVKDEEALLTEIKKVLKKTPIIFVMNKIDSVDEKRENVEEMILNYRAYLKNIGFENPEVYPVSSRYARLLKMKRDGKEGLFSPMEQMECSMGEMMFSQMKNLSGDSKSTDLIERTGLVNIEKRLEKYMEKKNG